MLTEGGGVAAGGDEVDLFVGADGVKSALRRDVMAATGGGGALTAPPPVHALLLLAAATADFEYWYDTAAIFGGAMGAAGVPDADDADASAWRRRPQTGVGVRLGGATATLDTRAVAAVTVVNARPFLPLYGVDTLEREGVGSGCSGGGRCGDSGSSGGGGRAATGRRGWCWRGGGCCGGARSYGDVTEDRIKHLFPFLLFLPLLPFFFLLFVSLLFLFFVIRIIAES